MADFDDEVDVITNEEKLKIAQHFLLSSPPGQFNEVYSDVKKLLPEDVLTESLVGGMARVFNLKNSKVVTAPSGKNVVIHQAGEVDPTHYFDPSSGAVFQVDHMTCATSESPGLKSEQDETQEPLRATLQSGVEGYVSAAYLSTMSAGGAFVKDGEFTIVITGEKSNLKNFWSGKWNSVWKIEVDEEAATYKISGEIKILAHYFEDGNLQLTSNKVVPTKDGKYESDTDLCAGLMAAIRAEESAMQTSLERLYENMSDTTLRSLRRTMAITRTKMEWNINAVRMNKQVRK